ncbi:multidrug/biocide efflux PACE transporter [Affinibrenneria salicis]|uniref:Multidrug/biocide efflux PACE transporter n=1 Tax=Affinibrenneria salicis TaxID=2590031 RepID=A0A5J5FWB6_9GAMM|nr:multidrug/biocide efflux PACE transporter [Affinibrenneria salicis]KAA8997706.1 multidrug/biocide efflux PACE transporter [Affinibrenneria salicis]
MKQKSFAERLLHATGFEVLAIAIAAPISALLLQRDVLEMGLLSLLLSTIAMIWNIVYNMLFDRLWPADRVARRLWVRIGHALGFEGGFILIGLPLVAWWLGITLPQAFMLEIGFFLFFLPYTMAYNWLYDRLRSMFFVRPTPARSR